MTTPNLPEPEKTWEQYDRICAHALFAKAANHQELLRFLIQLRYGSATDFSGKRIAFELFGRDTTIAKVEGRTLRQKLSRYYDSDGRNDAIIIRIPALTFKPEIRAATPDISRVSDCLEAIEAVFSSPEISGFSSALLRVKNYLAVEPRSPDLLGARALLHMMSMVYEEAPTDHLEMAEHIIRDLTSMNAMTYDAILAKACLMTMRCQWEAAKALFDQEQAIRPNGRESSQLLDWHLIFLVAQGQGIEAVNRLTHFIKSERRIDSLPYALCALTNIVMGDLDAAEQAIYNWGYNWADFRVDSVRMFFCAAILEGAKGNFLDAVSLLASIEGENPEMILGTALAGLIPLFRGLGGDRREARKCFDGLRDSRDKFLRDGKAEYPTAFQIALAALGAGELDSSAFWLELAFIEDNDPLVLWVHVWPFLEPLRKIGKFRQFVKRDLRITL